MSTTSTLGTATAHPTDATAAALDASDTSGVTARRGGPPRRLSLITPSGHLTLGNLLGALRPMADGQSDADCCYGISDLHALTTPHDPAVLRRLVAEQQALLLAVGLEHSTLFRQSRVGAHARLAYLLECVATTGELGRMIQFKTKGRDQPTTRVSLFTYPVLMAADILLYRPDVVPVGEDQRQHVELARDLARRFNHTYGPVFTVPEATTPALGARVMDLADPGRKMSKSATVGPGTIRLLDPPDVVRRAILRAVTDSDVGPDAVRGDPAAKPGVTNLIEILTACGGSLDGLSTYGALKRATVDAVVSTLAPIQRRYAELAAEPDHVAEVYERGEARARAVTEPVLESATAALGL